VVSQIISHPGIEYAERILPRKNDSELCAADSLDAHRNRRETHPAVAAGIAGAVDAAAPVSALVAKPVRAAGGMVTVPDCNGSDARDALQLLYRQGLTPVMSGAGLVRTQLPRAGTMVRQAAACTLFCSLDG